MTTIGETLTQLANTSLTLIAALGTPATRFLPDTIGNAARPAIAYQRIDDVPSTVLHGRASLYRARWQCTIFARSAVERDRMLGALRATYDTYSDRFDGGIIDTISVTTPLDSYDANTKDYLSFVDMIIWHTPETPT